MKCLIRTRSLAACAILILTIAGIADAAEKPNILIIYADDMGYGDCTINNPESKIPTPNIDRLAKEGLRFTDAHSPSTTCTASRYGLLTGITPARRGVVNGINQLGPVLEAKELTIAEMLKARGYATRMVGKWHLGFERTPSEGRRPVLDLSKPFTGGPIDHGFESFLGMNSAMSSGPYYFIRDRGPEVMPTGSTAGTKAKDRDRRETYAAGELAPGFVHEEVNARLCDEVVGIIRKHAAQSDSPPLFLYYAMLQPHTPWLPEARFAGKSGAGPYGDYMVQLDHELGRVLAALKESGMEKQTLVFFTSDNGALWPDADIEKYGHRANGPLSGGKARPEEGGHRVPFIARWPGHIPAGTTTAALVNHTDFLATFAELLEVDLAKATAGFPSIDSHSFLPVLKMPDAGHDRPAMAVTAGSFRDGEWKLTFTRGPRSTGADGREAEHAGLYDLSEDIGETRDLSTSHPERKAQLFAAYQAYFANAPLKPLAIQFRANKNSRTKPARKPPPPAKIREKPARPATASSSGESKAGYQKRRTELREKMMALLSEEQKTSSEAARKQAITEGKKGVALRNAIEAGARMSDAQRAQWDALRAEIGRLTRERKESLQNP